MISTFQFNEGRLLQVTIDETPLDQAQWVDLVDPSDKERAEFTACFRHSLPETEDVEEIEASARSYEDNDGLHIHSLFLHDVDGQPRNTSVAFTLSQDRLYTLREREIPAFRLLRMRARHDASIAQGPVRTILSLFEIKIDHLADTLEDVYTGLETVSTLVLEDNDSEMEDALDALARHEDTNGKIRLCLMDTQRALIFFLRRGRLDKEQEDHARELLRDIESLLPHNSFVFDKINFLMDAAQGFINIQQNKIIKIFSIAAVVFLPPTMVASIYGMNFRVIPELNWSLGYPAALILMAISGIAPYWYFKRKGWL